MANALSFLKHGKYEEADNFMENQITNVVFDKHLKQVGGKNIKFEIRDSVTCFDKSMWKRVCAVFLSGEEWQLKDWKRKDETNIDIFLRVRGYYMTYEDLPIPNVIGQWNVKQLRLSRYDDQTRQIEFWKDLCQFLNKPRYHKEKTIMS